MPHKGTLNSRKLFPFYAAGMTAVLYLLILFFSNILGYGNHTILSGDLYQQYIAFIHSFLDALFGKRDFWYSFSLFYGSGTASTYAYYCLSPFNLLYLLPFSDSAVTIVLILCKLSLAAALFNTYIQHSLKQTSAYTILFSVAYALSTYAIGFELNIMWLDALYILPVLMIFLIRFTEGYSLLPLVIIYAYLFLSNFYMGYIVGIFSALCFLALMLIKLPSLKKEDLLSTLTCGLKFASAVILAAGCSAAILIPAASELLQPVGDRTAFNLLALTIPDVLNNFFLGEMQSLGSPIPLLYCGLPVLFLMPLYFCAKDIDKKEKTAAAVILLFYLAVSIFTPLYSFIHAFEAPNWFAHRYAFCVVFLILSISARTSSELKQHTPKTLGIYLSVFLLFYSLMIPFQNLRFGSYQINTPEGLILNALFLGAYFLCFCLYHHKQAAKLLPVLLTLTVSAELTVNGHIALSVNNFGLLTESQLAEHHNGEEDAINLLNQQDTGLYRVRINGEHRYNSPSYYHFAGLNSFASADNAKLRSTLASLGIAAPFANIYDQGYTELTDMLFGVKYTVNLNGTNTANISANATALPIGFMVSDGILSYQSTADPFKNQEDLLRLMSGSDHSFFTPVSHDDLLTDLRNMEILDLDGNTLYRHISNVPVNGKVFYMLGNADDRRLMAYYQTGTSQSLNLQAPVIYGKETGFSLPAYISVPTIIEAKYYQANTIGMEIDFSAGPYFDYLIQHPYFYLYDSAELPQIFNDLNSNPLIIDKWSDSHITGSVTATGDRPILFTSIPYDNNWQLWVDGQPSRAGVTVNGTFLSVYLTPGTHTIELLYEPSIVSVAKLISAVSCILVLILSYLAYKKKTNPVKESPANEE